MAKGEFRAYSTSESGFESAAVNLLSGIVFFNTECCNASRNFVTNAGAFKEFLKIQYFDLNVVKCIVSNEY